MLFNIAHTLAFQVVLFAMGGVAAVFTVIVIVSMIPVI